jgi:23S rRNA pseudouridine1911/1915/1917 synthase
VLEHYAGRPAPERLHRSVKAAGKGSKGSKKAAKSGEPIASLIACRLETGRTHQIRVHMASIGHPLLGDRVYGAGFRTKSTLLPPKAQAALADLGRQALHAHILAVEHPTSGEFLKFRSELPPDLVRLHDALAGSRTGTGTMWSGE